MRNNNVTLALEDFSMKLKFEALKCIVDFIYEGEVSVPMELFKDVCDVASALGIHDLMEYLPTTKKAQSQNCSTQSEEIEQPTASSSSRAEQASNQPNPQHISSIRSTSVVFCRKYGGFTPPEPKFPCRSMLPVHTQLFAEARPWISVYGAREQTVVT